MFIAITYFVDDVVGFCKFRFPMCLHNLLLIDENVIFFFSTSVFLKFLLHEVINFAYLCKGF